MPNKVLNKVLPKRSDSHNEGGDLVCKRTNAAGVVEVCDWFDGKCKSYPLCKAGGSCALNVEFFDHCPWVYRQVWSILIIPPTLPPEPVEAPKPVVEHPKTAVPEHKSGTQGAI